MSMSYKYTIDVSPVDEHETEAIISAMPYEVDGHDWYKDKLMCWGEGFLAACDPSERHTEIQAAFPGKKIASRWRCTEYDEWDEEFDDVEAPDDESKLETADTGDAT